jgi:hypothetical protein
VKTQPKYPSQDAMADVTQPESNPRGIPKAIFIDKVSLFSRLESLIALF